MLGIHNYLKGTQKGNLVLCPNKKINVKCYTDADFSDMYGSENHQDPICIESSNIYVITFIGCNILWVSKLYTDISLSALHSEYITSYQPFRECFPIKDLI